MRTFFFLLACFLLLPFHGAHAAQPDLSISANNISFSKPLVAGDHVRIYATVKNVGDTDVSGYVSFFQGSMVINDSLVISLRAGGLPEEVYVDFVVPSGAFNIRAEIKGTDPVDVNPSNDVAITKLLTPLLDDDRDGIPNDKDNCPNNANANQLDTDGDAIGDVCDSDDDNDGLSDDVEKELGTNPLVKDTDGDGVNDATDAFPTDPKRWKVESTVPAPQPVPTPAPPPAKPLSTLPAVKPAVAALPVAPKPAKSVPTPTEAPVEPDSVTPPVADPAPLAPVGVPSDMTKTSFTFTRKSWNTFAFTTVTPEDPRVRYAWDFGDGVTSNRHTVEHTFVGTGDYAVHLAVTDADGNTAEDSTTISVPFFALENPWLLGILGVLGLILLIGLISLIRLNLKARRMKQSAMEPNEMEETNQEEPEDRKQTSKKLRVRKEDDES